MKRWQFFIFLVFSLKIRTLVTTLFAFVQFTLKTIFWALLCFSFPFFLSFFSAGWWWWWGWGWGWWWTNKWEIKENFRKSKETLQIQDNLLKKQNKKSAYFYSSTSFMQTCPSALAKVFAVFFVIKSSGAMCIFKLD